ncbi:MAG: EAL domain-containing protein, partial [Wenzhouxiangella sp.]
AWQARFERYREAHPALAREFLRRIQCKLPAEITSEALIEKASAAIRFAGDRRPGAVRFFSEGESLDVSQRLTLVSRLRRALNEKQFHLQYQPIVSLHDGKMVAVEALLRWQEPELGNVPPDRFIHVAEESGLIVPIGRWVQEEVCRQIGDWRQQAGWDVPVSINVAPVELLQRDFASSLLKRLENAGIPASLLCTEVTELELITDSLVVEQNLALLQEASIDLYIDDFGTGYSSLDYLRRMPLNRLKIDRSFIQGIPESRPDAELTRIMIAMAHTLGLGIVAEGIENREQLEFLQNTGCELGQGFLISHPVDADRIPSLRNRRLV